MNESNAAAINQTANRGIFSGMKASSLPKESADSFSKAPFEFEESSSILWNDTQKVYYHACTANRFSEEYLSLCSQLEKNIKQLGSICLTKAVLEQKDRKLDKLSNLNIRELVCMVSFHMRKAHAALEGIYNDNDILGLAYLNWEFRWVGLGNRLKATEIKISKIKEGKLNIETMLQQAETFSNDQNESQNQSDRQNAYSTDKDAAPINVSMARVMLEWEKEDAKNAERARREQEKKIREAERLEREADRLTGCFKPPLPFSPDKNILAMLNRENAQKLRSEVEAEQSGSAEKRNEKPESRIQNQKEKDRSNMITEEEARKRLMADAIKRNDRAAIEAIPTEDSAAFKKRWKEYLERVVREKIASDEAPPSDTRKALRDKRKKKKKK